MGFFKLFQNGKVRAGLRVGTVITSTALVTYLIVTLNPFSPANIQKPRLKPILLLDQEVDVKSAPPSAKPKTPSEPTPSPEEAVTPTTPDYKTSIDCSKDLDNVGQAICKNTTLVDQDKQVTALYSDVERSSPKSLKILKITGDAWIQRRNDCMAQSKPEPCLQGSYQQRIGELQRIQEVFIEEASAQQPPKSVATASKGCDLQAMQELPDYLKKYCN